MVVILGVKLVVVRVARVACGVEPGKPLWQSRVHQVDDHVLPPAPRGISQIKVIVDIDTNGVIEVSTTDMASSVHSSITLTSFQNHLSQEDIERMAKETENFATIAADAAATSL
eukprot:COSAG06_NODE_3218_length_5663_cov_8.989216_9_plen_114_part_00